MTVASASATVAVPQREAWALLADFGAVAMWASVIDHSRLLSDPPAGLGAVRRVQLGRQALLETATVWKPDRRLAYRISGLPPILAHVVTSWDLEVTSDRACTVTVSTEIGQGTPRLVARLALIRISRVNRSLLSDLERRLTNSAAAPTALTSTLETDSS